MDSNLSARIAVLETKQNHTDQLNVRRDEKIDEMYEVIMKLKGAKWVGWFIAASFGFVVSNIHTIWQMLTKGS